MGVLDTILPVVLVGGKSRRFGRDKLREPRPFDALLVDGPIGALRAVFGPRVAVCGVCDPEVSARADAVIDDLYPGTGPLGGIVSALTAAQAAGRDWVFVLAGDLPGISPGAVLALLAAKDVAPEAKVVAAYTDRLQPCIALYHESVLSEFIASLPITGARTPALAAIVTALGTALKACPIDSRWAANVNTPGELAAFDLNP